MPLLAKRSILCAHGYVREYEKTHMYMIIPTEIYNLIGKFYRIPNTWDKKTCSLSIQIDGDCVTAKDCSVYSVYGNTKVKPGSIHEWTLTIKEIYHGGNSGHPYIGVVKDDVTLLVDGCSWYNGNGYLFECINTQGEGCKEVWPG
eukprot:497783_1